VVLSDTGGVRQVLCPVLVGRAGEVRHLEAALAAAGAGRGGVVLITGEAGIGKSRLVREAARAAEALGLVVLTGRAVASDVPTPFRPFAEALASAGRAGRLPDGTTPGSWATSRAWSSTGKASPTTPSPRPDGASPARP
jgi:hypothetical protein